MLPVNQRDLIYPHGDHGVSLGIRSYGRLWHTPCARIRRVGLVMDSVSSRSKGTRLGVKRQGVLFVARSGCQGLPGAAIDAAGIVGATGEPATKARRLPPVASMQAHAAHEASRQPANPLGLVSPLWAAHRRAPCRCTCALRLPPGGRSPGPAPGLTTGDSGYCCVSCLG